MILICLGFRISCLGFYLWPMAVPCSLPSACLGEAPWAKPGPLLASAEPLWQSRALCLPRRSHFGKAGPTACPNSSCWQGVIMQNKANFQKTKMNLTLYSKMAYEKNICSDNPKNKANQTQFSFSVGFGIWVLDIGICLWFWIWCSGFYYLVTAPTRHDFAKQTQFSKMRNKPKPMPRKDL